MMQKTSDLAIPVSLLLGRGESKYTSLFTRSLHQPTAAQLNADTLLIATVQAHGITSDALMPQRGMI